ncbi:MAG: DUF4403 family protein, partial [Sphingomonadaceae bacterium]
LLSQGWKDAHTSLELNARNPQVWMRVAPQALSVQPYRISRGEIVLPLVLEATSETFVGPRPPDPPVAPLPPPASLDADGFRLVIPVVADYEVLEGVLHRALAKAAARGIMVPVLGAVDARFGRPTMYATRDRRLAVGLPIDAQAGAMRAKGMVWLTAEVWNAPDTQTLEVRDLRLTGDIAGPQGALLLAVAQAPVVSEAIADELTQNFTRDFLKLRGKIDRALTDKRLGMFVLNARIEDVRNGVIQPLGQGAFLLVEAAGTAELRVAPPVPAAAAQASRRGS